MRSFLCAFLMVVTLAAGGAARASQARWIASDYAAPPPRSPPPSDRLGLTGRLAGVGGALMGLGYYPMVVTSMVCFGYQRTWCGGWSLLPVAGPFVLAADELHKNDFVGAHLLIVEGLVQLSGIAL